MPKVGIVLTVGLVLLVGTFANAEASDYEIVADYLWQATNYSALEDNALVAAGVLREQPTAGPGLRKLARAISSLRGTNENKDIFCSRENMANLRAAAEAMQRDGNLAPARVTQPIRRLNSILIKTVGEAWTTCIKHLESKWVTYKLPVLDTDWGLVRVAGLSKLPLHFLYKGVVGQSEFEARNFEDSLSQAMKNSQGWSPALVTDKDEQALKKQLVEFIDKPCAELLAYEHTDPPPFPYAYLDLLAARYLIGPDQMAEFYKNADEMPADHVSLTRDHPESSPITIQIAKSHAACAWLMAMPKKDLVKAIVDSRDRLDRVK